MIRFLLTAVLTAALGVALGVWLDSRMREVRQREQAAFELRVERELSREVSLAGYAGGPMLLDVLRHVARQTDLPIAFKRQEILAATRRRDEKCHLPPAGLSLRAMLGLLLRQSSLDYYLDDGRLVITSSQEAEGRLTTRVYPLPQLAGPEQPFGTDMDTWIEVLSIVIEPDSWEDVGGQGEIVPVPGALVIRQSRRVHERLRQFFETLHRDSPTPDAEGDYLSSLTLEERRIYKALNKTCDFQCTDSPLQIVVESLSREHGVPIYLSLPELEELSIDANKRLTLKMKGASLRSVLLSLLEPIGLTFQIRDDLLVVTTPEDSDSEERAVVYDVRDLVVAKEGLDFDSLMELMTTTVSPGNWSDRSGPGPINELLPGWLAFREADVIHEGTAKLLTQLRAHLRIRASGQAVTTPESPAQQRLAAAWEQNITLSYREQPLREVVADLAERSGVNMRIDESYLAETGLSLGTPITCDLPPLPLKTALNRLVRSPPLAEYMLAWTVRDESLVLSNSLDANFQQELLILDVHDLVEPQEDEHAFDEDAFQELVESVVRPRNWNGAANVSTFRSLLVCSAPRHVNQQIRKIVKGIRQYRKESHPAKKLESPRSPLTVIDAEPDVASQLRVKIYPADDLLGDEGSARLLELKAAIQTNLEDKWREANGSGSFWIGEVIPVPPAGLLAAQSQTGHDEVQLFLGELRQHLVPEQPIPDWLAAHNARRQELEQALSSREDVLTGVTRMKQLRTAVERAIKKDVALGVLYLVRELGKIPENTAAPLAEGSEPPTVKEQLAGLGLAVVDTEHGLKLLRVEDDLRLGILDTRELFTRQNPFEVDEICTLLDSPLLLERSAETPSTSPVCFRGWIIVRQYDQRLRQLAELVAWLKQQPEVPRGWGVHERRDPKETALFIRQLLGSSNSAERIYVSFLLQFAAPREDGCEELALRIDAIKGDQNSLEALRLTESLNRWTAVLSNEQLESLFASSQSPFLRMAAMQSLASRLSDPTGEILETRLNDLIKARQDLSPEEEDRLRLALKDRRSPPALRTEFETKDRSGTSALLRPTKSTSPPWRRHPGSSSLGKDPFN